MELKRFEKKLCIVLDERIDTSNIAEVETQISKAVEEADPDCIELNAKRLEFITSVGLRMLLKLVKQKKEVCVTEVSPEIYEIFEVTGFDNLLKIRRALREISIEGCKMIGKGGTAAVYRLNEDTIIKLYNDNVDYETIEKEKIYTRKAFELGMPCAISYDIVKCDEKYGIIYEMIHSNTLSEAMAQDPEHIEKYADEYAKLGRGIHELKADPEIYPRTVQIYHEEIELLAPYLEKEDIQVLHDFVEQVPETSTLIHGDFHPNNIMIQDGEYLMIDMADVSWGHPIYELACTYTSLVSIASKGDAFTKSMYGLTTDELLRVWNQFVKSYFEVNEQDRLEEIDAMLQPFVMLKNVLRLVSAGPVPEEVLPMLIGMTKAKLIPAIKNADMNVLKKYFKDMEQEAI